MVHHLRTQEDSQHILDFFNGFHDGFIHKLVLRSHDVFTKDGPEITDIAHQLTGRFDVRIDIAHYNYGQRTQPHDRIVRCFFRNVRDFHFDLRSTKSFEWPLKNVELTAGDRVLESGGLEPCFALVMMWGRLVDQSWDVRKEHIFTFEEAEFEERTLSV